MARKAAKQRRRRALARWKGVPAPRAVKDSVDLADWLELVAMSTGNASKADLRSILTRSGEFDRHKDRDDIDQLCLTVFSEIESRLVAAGDKAYPFIVQPPLITRRPAAMKDYAPYIFCLCLSAWRWIKPRERPASARQLFEDLSCVAAKSFIGGEVVRFASPRKAKIRGFKEAIDHVCNSVGEGRGFQSGKAAKTKKDDTLDVVAWRDFPDRRAGKLILFGQCASGNDWDGKRTELQPREFVDMWWERAPVVPLLRAFFLPHRLDTRDWEETNRKAGLTFDRCRLSFWAQQETLPQKTKFVTWSQSVIRSR